MHGGPFQTKGDIMKRTIITTIAAVAAVLAAAYLTGADGSTGGTPQPGTTGTQTPTPLQQFMQAPSVVTEECDGYILLLPCPVCHTCPVCQANCGTAHALRCCVGNKKPASCTQTGTGTAGQQHIMTNKAEAVKHAAGRTTAPQQVEAGEISVLTIESN